MDTPNDENRRGLRARRAAEGVALAGLLVYAMAAPHSIAGSWMGLSVAVLGWLARTLLTRRAGIRRSLMDAPLWLLFAWTALSSALSYEPQESLPKLVNAATFLVFYVAQSLLTRRRAVMLALVIIVSGVAGVWWSLGEIAVGRGVVVTEVRAGSPFRATLLQAGDAVWRVNGRRVSSIAEIDREVRAAKTTEPLRVSVISRGEHVEWQAPPVTEESKAAASPSGLAGGGPTRSFRASGWTRHYETHAECLQMIAQLALGLALALWLRRGPRAHALLAAAAFALLAVGVALTAMRTVLVAFAVGALAVAWRAGIGRRARLLVAAAVVVVLALGALTVWRTRAGGALRLGDASSSTRLRVATVAAGRVALHPVFGHGMDSAHRHWREWGFPGDDMLHAHSTPVQLAFDRGLPALALWLWLMAACWLVAARAEKIWRDADSAAAHGLMLGATGAITGLFASSLVNYNFGDAEVTLLLWWITGAAVALGGREP
jgi:hypothetical protein